MGESSPTATQPSEPVCLGSYFLEPLKSRKKARKSTGPQAPRTKRLTAESYLKRDHEEARKRAFSPLCFASKRKKTFGLSVVEMKLDHYVVVDPALQVAPGE
jgi:hypothetical protein